MIFLNPCRYIKSADEINGYLNKPIYYINGNVEIWMPINLEVCPNIIPDVYFVSNWGQVYTSARNKLLAFELSNTGYFRVHLLRNDNKNKADHISIHRLVLGTFNPVPNMKELFVNHIDGCKINNNLYNLEWTTESGNSQHAIRTGLTTWKTGDDCSWSKINSEQADQIGYLISTEQFTHQQIADMIGCSKSIVSFISSGVSWREVYYKYKLRLIKLKHKYKTNFTPEQHKQIRQYIINNLYKYESTDLRFLCMDIMKELYNTILNRSLYVELMDIIDEIREGN